MKKFTTKLIQTCLCLSLVISLTPISGAYASETEEKGEAGAGTQVSITLESNLADAVSMTYGGVSYTSGTDVDAGDELVVTLSNKLDGTNILMPTALTIDGVAQDLNYNKSSWQVANSEYKRLMNEDVKMATYEKIAASTIVVSAGTINTNAVINVEYTSLMPVYRLYNKLTSEHLFTANRDEYTNFEKLTSQNKEN